jgi:predicted phage terminase large subunit-like protein
MSADHELFASLMHEDLGAFTEATFGTLLPSDPYIPSWHMRAISHVLEQVVRGSSKRLIITMPPRCAKSLTASVALPAWILGRDPTRRIICVSYAQDLAVKLSNQCRSVVGSPWYRSAFKNSALNPRKNTESEFETTRGGFRMATSVGGTLTGRGANIIIIDDPIKPTDAYSETVRTSTNRWVDLTLFSRLDNKVEGAIILVMQRLHEEDLAGHLLERGGWDHLNLPAIAESDERVPTGFNGNGQLKFHRRRTGDVLVPGLEPKEKLDEMKKALGTQGFAAQYQQQPVPSDGDWIHWAWFGRFAVEPTWQRNDTVMQSWDTASKTSEVNDFSVCTTWLVRGEFFYLLHVHRERMKAPDLRRRAVELYDRFRPEAVIIEDKGSGMGLIQDLENELPVIAFEPSGDKQMRASNRSSCIEAGRVWIPKAAPWLDAFEREVLAFPNGKHDDQVDSMVQFLTWYLDSERNSPRIRQL